MRRGTTGLVLACLTVILVQLPTNPLRAADVRIFAAASTTKPLHLLLDILKREKKVDVTPVFAASGALARQIEFGAPADLFLTANPIWMNWLQEKQRVKPSDRVELVSNCLVIIQPQTSAPLAPLGSEFAVLNADARLVIGDPAYVPVGQYAKKALIELKLWQTLSSKAARLPSAQHVLRVIERGEADIGIVYRSDAVTSGRVHVSETINPALYPKIIYSLAMIHRPKPAQHVAPVFRFLLSKRAINVFEEHGFRRLEGTCPG